MKRILSVLALAIMACTAASAQNNIYRAVVGPYQAADGNIVVADPSTTIVVDLTIEKEQTIVGPYARYAQKYLDVRGSLVDKTTYAVKDANLSVMACDGMIKSGETAPATVSVESYMNPVAEFPKVLPNRLSMSPSTIEDAASQAAQAIFTLRKKRMELITGDAGENVFGGGLQDALKALEAQEQAYLELFLGKKVTTVYTERFIVPMTGAESYTIAKLSSSAGLEAATAANGTEIKLTVKGSGVTPKLNSIPEIDPKDKTAIMVRLADNATCAVSVGDKMVGSAILPVFELGRTAYIANTIIKK
ncbi:MAG: DUF4831 family protein [Alistipes sp.]|nr:DUF4831 family protein [Alistipes sp.]